MSLKSKQYRHLFFDLDKTLWDFETNSYKALKEAFREKKLFNRVPSFDEYFKVYSKINDKLWEKYRKNEVSKAQLITERFKDSLAEFGISINGQAEIINQTYLEIMPGKTNLVPGALEMLEELKKRKYHIHIITNGFKTVQRQKIRKSGLAPFISGIFISEEIGRPKPHREVFEHAVKSCNAKKTESLMIGDNWEADIIGAREFGMDQIYFLPEGEFNEDDNTLKNTSCVRISQLSEIPDLLKDVIW